MTWSCRRTDTQGRQGDLRARLLQPRPVLFERPDEFDVTRPYAATRRNYRTFGGGPHFCLGINQARMSLTVMLEEIVTRMDNLRLLAEPKHARSIFMDGFKELRLGWDKRVGA